MTRHWLAGLLMSASVLAWSLPAQATDADASSPIASAPAPAESRTSDLPRKVSKDWFKDEWAAYRASFVSPDGRVIDNANHDRSHSEGQGYALLLAVKADDAAGFDLIWRWTAVHLRTRPDALFAWSWDPRRQKVVDANDASDGDVLIAWALTKAATQFARPDYAAEARRIVETLGEKVVRTNGEDVLLLPAAAGFGAANQPDGPVVNISYWIFAAFKDLAPLSPKVDWAGLRRTGLKLLDASRFGPRGLPADWIAVGGASPAPGAKFPAQFGYNAIRIPLYLAQDDEIPREVLLRFAAADFPASSSSGPAVIDIATGAVRQAMPGAGYRMVMALIRCAANGDTVPPDLMSTRDTFYYPETLRLLSISVVQERFPQCL